MVQVRLLLYIKERSAKSILRPRQEQVDAYGTSRTTMRLLAKHANDYSKHQDWSDPWYRIPLPRSRRLAGLEPVTRCKTDQCQVTTPVVFNMDRLSKT